MEKISGIYRIVCIKNGRYYYGSSKDVWKRWGGHKTKLRYGNHPNPIMQNSFNKHGEASFRIELIESVSENELREVEQKYLNEYFGKANCMNLVDHPAGPGESRTGGGNFREGFTHSEITRERMSKAAEGRVFSVEHIANLKKSSQRRWAKKEEREKHSLATKLGMKVWLQQKKEKENDGYDVSGKT